jgi:hypothetical protein
MKMATPVFAETVDNFQHSTLLIPESRSCVLNSSRENLRTIISHLFNASICTVTGDNRDVGLHILTL